MAFKWPRRINVTKCYKLPYQMNINKSTLCRKSLTDTNADVHRYRYRYGYRERTQARTAAISSWWGQLAPGWSTNMANMSIQQNAKKKRTYLQRESPSGDDAGQMEMRTNLDCGVLTQPNESNRIETQSMINERTWLVAQRVEGVALPAAAVRLPLGGI